ncbi:MAG: cytochrome c biogenesis protein CcdA [Xanthobacteraceae bacterium]|nr:cytochrome c biogenesis protein CcdA [Xanthobacteraceae bacterium]
MTLATLGLALLAGLLSVLSPCVLPLLPIVLGAAASEHRFGPAALAAGVAVSFVAVGLFVATVGFSIGLDGEVVRRVAAVAMIVIGVVLMVPALQARVATAGGPVGNWVDQTFGGGPMSGLQGQFAMGLLLGAVWSPCVGPTLGAASVLAAQGKDIAAVGATMAVFGIGAALPLVVLGAVSRDVLIRWRQRMATAGQVMKQVLAVMLIAAGVLIVTGLDKALETYLVNASPAWLTSLTTRF